MYEPVMNSGGLDEVSKSYEGLARLAANLRAAKL
jgi:hypothetical protein